MKITMDFIKKCPVFVLVILSSLMLGAFKGYEKVQEYRVVSVNADNIGMIEQKTVSGQQPQETVPVEDTLSGNQTEKKVLELTEVSSDYFQDALFIGDSRTDGLKSYSKSLTGAVFYAKVGLTIHNLLESKIVEVPEEKEKITIEEALSRYSYGKIYLCVGINELGVGTVETYRAAYEEVLQRIRQLQPEAIIFIQANMRVTKEQSEKDALYNNKNITERNEAIRTLADGEQVFYLDMNEVVQDEEGNLNQEYTFDGIHLKAAHYNLWEEYLYGHGIIQ